MLRPVLQWLPALDRAKHQVRQPPYSDPGSGRLDHLDRAAPRWWRDGGSALASWNGSYLVRRTLRSRLTPSEPPQVRAYPWLGSMETGQAPCVLGWALGLDRW
jgi:hypothetical protein